MPSVSFSNHARTRLEERGIDPDLVAAIVLRPTFKGDAGSNGLWAAGMVIWKGRRSWLTAIYATAGEDLAVLTTYMGPPSRIRTVSGISHP